MEHPSKVGNSLLILIEIPASLQQRPRKRKRVIFLKTIPVCNTLVFFWCSKLVLYIRQSFEKMKGRLFVIRDNRKPKE